MPISSSVMWRFVYALLLLSFLNIYAHASDSESISLMKSMNDHPSIESSKEKVNPIISSPSPLRHPERHHHAHDTPAGAPIKVHHMHGSQHHHDSNQKKKEKSLKKLIDHHRFKENESAMDFAGCNQKACCQGCDYDQSKFSCKKKCRICCADGEAAVCDNTATCKCESPQTNTSSSSPSSSKLIHQSITKPLHEQVEIPHLSVVDVKKKIAAQVESMTKEAKEHNPLKQKFPFFASLLHVDSEETQTAALSLTDIIIIVVVVVVVLFCCGGFGYHRYSRTTI